MGPGQTRPEGTAMNTRMLQYRPVCLAALFFNSVSAASLPPLNFDLGETTLAIRPGISYVHLHSLKSETQSPLSIHLLEVDLKNIAISNALALDQILGKEKTSSLAARYGAVAAVNGGFFKVSGNHQGDLAGFFVKDGVILSEPVYRHSSFGFCLRKGKQVPVFDQIKQSSAIITSRGKAIPISGINRQRGNSETVVYTPHFGRTTLTDSSGVEFVVQNETVKDIRRGAGSSLIPAQGFVISASSPVPARRILATLNIGTRVAIEHRLTSLRAHQQVSVEGCSYVSAGPTLVLAGEKQTDFLNESKSFGAGFSLKWHPRTAVALRGDGTLLFVVVDGRQPELSVGMTLPELADFLIQRDANTAYNLDGGGSSTMVVDGKIVNSPSDRSRERPVSDAILLFEKIQD